MLSNICEHRCYVYHQNECQRVFTSRFRQRTDKREQTKPCEKQTGKSEGTVALRITIAPQEMAHLVGGAEQSLLQDPYLGSECGYASEDMSFYTRHRNSTAGERRLGVF